MSLESIPRAIRDILFDRNNESLFVYDISSGRYCGATTANNVTIAFEDECMVIANSRYHMMVTARDGFDQAATESNNETVDLDASGRRWEGGIRDGKPNGYGILYDEDGREEYKGFMLDGEKTCYGIEYYSDLFSKRYEGCHYKGKRLGKGILYDRNGSVECKGLWWKDELYSSACDGSTIDNHTESLTVPNGSFNNVASFCLHSYLYSLRQIVIGNDCFGTVRFFELDGLCGLESVVIGEKSITNAKTQNDVMQSQRADGVYRIVNCPKLKSIQIGDYSFSDYHSFDATALESAIRSQSNYV